MVLGLGFGIKDWARVQFAEISTIRIRCSVFIKRILNPEWLVAALLYYDFGLVDKGTHVYEQCYVKWENMFRNVPIGEQGTSR